MRPLFVLPLTLALAACSPTTPLFVGQVAGYEIDDYKEMKNNRLIGAYQDEGDLLMYSALSIRDAKSADAEQTYLNNYEDRALAPNTRALMLYQIGLIYMCRFNYQRDDGKARTYFTRTITEFPDSLLAERSKQHLQRMAERDKEPVQKNSRELLMKWKPEPKFDLHDPHFDPEMHYMARRAVLKDQVAEAAPIYLILTEDPGLPQNMREDALLQLGYMYLSPLNPRPDGNLGLTYARRLYNDYPPSIYTQKALSQITRTLNRTWTARK